MKQSYACSVVVLLVPPPTWLQQCGRMFAFVAATRLHLPLQLETILPISAAVVYHVLQALRSTQSLRPVLTQFLQTAPWLLFSHTGMATPLSHSTLTLAKA